MAHAYTPGLKVTDNEVVSKRRILPLKGEVVVESGVTVEPDDVVARTFLPGKVEIVNVANKMGVDQSDVPEAMIKNEGDRVICGEVIAVKKALFGLLKSEATACLDGTIESISGVTGQVVLRTDPEPVDVRAYVEGRVVEVMPEEGVTVETCGAYLQGIFGVGGETHGELVIVSPDAHSVLNGSDISADHSGKIVVGGSLVTGAALKRAIQLGVRGVVVGGFDDQDLREFLGGDLGVAITGHENLGVTLIVTEGFGQIDMAPTTYALLKKHAGARASINGATQIRAGVIRPEVIIPLADASPSASVATETKGMAAGGPVRIIRNPYFGCLGTVKSLPPEPGTLESGSKARVVEVELTSTNEVVIVPRANVEIIEGHD